VSAGRKTVVDRFVLVEDPPPLSADAHLTEISGFISTHTNIDSSLLTRQVKKADLSVYCPALLLTLLRELTIPI